MSLRARLLSGFGVMAALVIGFSGYMLLQQAQIRERVQYLARERADVQNRLQDLRGHLGAVQRNALQAALSRDRQLLEHAIKESALLFEVFAELRREAAGDALAVPDRAGMLRFLDRTEALYRETTQRSFATLRELAAGRAVDATRIARLRLDSIRMNSAFDAYLTELRGDSAIALQSFLERIERLRPLSLSIAALALLAMGAFLFLLQRYLTLPLRQLTRFVAGISDPANVRDRAAVNRSDEIGTIAAAVNGMLERLHETTVSRDHLDHILANLSNALIVTDRAGRIDTINRAACAALGADQASLLGRLALDSLPAAVAEPLARNESLRDLEADFVTPDGQRRPMLVSATRLEHEDGGCVIVATDIAERKRAEEDIRAALVKQRELNELKSRFVSMTSHEFRTPLSAIQSSAELLKYYGDRLSHAERHQLMSNIETSIARMVRMLDDILLLGRVDAGRLVFRPAPVDLLALCRRVVEETRRAAGDHKPGLAVELTVQGACSRPILDENLLRHILSNLVSNALKYSPMGSCVRVDVASDFRQVTLSVADQGIGIAAEDLPRVFQAFYRASNVDNIAGTGLGLAIVKAAVKLHGGTVEVESRVGEGSRFTVTLPQAAEASLG
jgi:PAS domain S-box-containing protein